MNSALKRMLGLGELSPRCSGNGRSQAVPGIPHFKLPAGFDRFFVTVEDGMQIVWADRTGDPALPMLVFWGLQGADTMHRPPHQLPDPELLPGLKGELSLSTIRAALAESGLAESPDGTRPAAVLSQNQREILSQAASTLTRSSPSVQLADTSLDQAITGCPVGRFHDALGCLEQTDFVHQIPRPAVVVVGLQSVGKSTFMEAITKRPIFPQGPGATTRAPVILHLQHAPSGAPQTILVTFRGTIVHLSDDGVIATTVAGFMQQVPADELTPDEITIRIVKPDVPSITLIDTPGISDQLPASYQIARHYLQQDSTLIICLVDAAYIDLAPHQAITMVRQAGKLDDAVLVLTRTDEVTTAKAIKERVIDRVLGRSHEMQRTGFRKAYAVIPKLPSGAAAAGASERQILKQQLLQQPLAAGESTPLPSMPAEAQADAKFLKAHTSMASLIAGIVPWFEGFVRRKGVPLALKWLQPKLQAAEDKLSDLGPPAEGLTVGQVMLEVAGNLDMQTALNTLNVHQESLPDLMIMARLGDHEVALPQLGVDEHFPAPDLSFYNEQRRLAQMASTGIEAWLGGAACTPKYWAVIQQAVRAAFAARSKLRPVRFAQLADVVLNERLARSMEIKEVRQAVLGMSCVRDLCLGMPDLTQPGALAKLDSDVRTAVIHAALLPLQGEWGTLARCMMDAPIPLLESAEYQTLRRDAVAHLDSVKAAVDIMQSIQPSADCTPAAGAAPLVGPAENEELQPAIDNHQVVPHAMLQSAISDSEAEVIDICDDDVYLPRPASTPCGTAAPLPAPVPLGHVPSPACPTTPLGPSGASAPTPSSKPRTKRKLVRVSDLHRTGQQAGQQGTAEVKAESAASSQPSKRQRAQSRSHHGSASLNDPAIGY